MERKHTFNEVAKEYDQYRPSYPNQLFKEIVEYADLKTTDDILEIGCGTGKATSGFVNLGYSQITAVEAGENLANLTRNKFRDKSSVTVVNSPFEDWHHQGLRFKLAISGTAFHFIQPQEAGYRKVHDLLNDQGSAAFFGLSIFHRLMKYLTKFETFTENTLPSSMIHVTLPWNKLLRNART